MDISRSCYAQTLQQLLPDQDFWMTAFHAGADFVLCSHIRQKPANCGITQVHEHFLKTWITTPLSEKMKMVEFEWRTPIIYCA